MSINCLIFKVTHIKNYYAPMEHWYFEPQIWDGGRDVQLNVVIANAPV